jgi:hypothetical protein
MDVQTWQAVPADNNPAADEMGTWAVVAGDGDEADVYVEVSAEYPKRVAEFLATAVRNEAGRVRFAGAAGDIADELARQRQADQQTPAAGHPYLPDTVRLALLTQQLGEAAGLVTANGAFSTDEAAKRLYEQLVQVGAATIGWMEALLGRERADHDV